MPPLCINLLDWMRQTLKPLGLKEKQLTFIHGSNSNKTLH